ncbi:unnamed protein product [Rotaria sp. Silwood1]|nr:unnamed protein product [Rotaria sp. Silwood1]CAF3659805.1 unnamed protein product [Rotaria sp. Silwood1]CAF4601446.1 unnamed protein product [Rotaria sp. Silwood1]
MSRARQNERVVLVETDGHGNILDYDVVDRPYRSYLAKKSSSVNRSQPIKQSPKFKAVEKYNEDDYEDENDDNDYQESRGNTSFSSGLGGKTRRDTTVETPPTSRRVRYVRPKSTVKIFQEKVDWNANPKIDARNDEAMEKILNAPKKKIYHEKPTWSGKPKIDSHNEEIVENILRAPKPEIFYEKPIWNQKPKIDSHNEEVVENILRAPKPQIYEEKIKWTADPKIDSHNEEAIERIKSAPKPIIYDEKLIWPTVRRTDHYNEQYVKHKEREKVSHKEKIYIQNAPQERKPKNHRARIDNQNPNFDEHIKRQKSAKLPPIESRKLEWQKRPRINQKNDDYIERMRQKRSIPIIYQEKLKWFTKSPKINARNEEYLDNLKGQARPKIINQLPRWRSQPKIDAYNDSYDPSSYTEPMIFSEKLRWHARPKIDTGLEPDPNEDQYVDYGLTA